MKPRPLRLGNPQQDSQIKYTVNEEYGDGSKYFGEKLNGTRHGFGKFSYADGGVYEGFWDSGEMKGPGMLYYPDGLLAYEGDFSQNCFNGQGKVYNQRPSPLSRPFDFRNFNDVEDHWEKYEGEFKEDLKEGSGTLYLANGEKFIGEFKQDMVCGSGIFYKMSGEAVTGIWVNNTKV